MTQTFRDIRSATDTTYMTHNIHPYPAKFIPQIPHHFIKKYTSSGDTVLDPFCGSGTTLVESMLTDRNSIGVDVNPIAILISKAKTTILNQNEITQLHRILNKIQKHSCDITTMYRLPDFNNRDHWFKKNVSSEIAFILNIIQSNKNEKIQDFLMATMSSIIVTVSNQQSDTRYVAVDKDIEVGGVVRLYLQKTQDALTRLESYIATTSNNVTCDVHCHDSRDLSILDTNSVDLVVTSPPYPNVYDYYLYHKQRMNCLGLDYKNARNEEIGSRLRYSSLKEDIGTFYDDMYDCFTELRRVVKPGKMVVFVMGDSIVQGELIDGFDIISDVGNKAHFSITGHSAYSLDDVSRTFGKGFRTKGKREHCVILKNGN